MVISAPAARRWLPPHAGAAGWCFRLESLDDGFQELYDGVTTAYLFSNSGFEFDSALSPVLFSEYREFLRNSSNGQCVK